MARPTVYLINTAVATSTVLTDLHLKKKKAVTLAALTAHMHAARSRDHGIWLLWLALLSD